MNKAVLCLTWAIFVSLTEAVAAQTTQNSPTLPIDQTQNTADRQKSIVIHQEADYPAPPERLYEALLDSEQFTAFSGRPAKIDRTVGGAFSLFAGHIIGRNLEFVPNRRIVQAWRVVTWPEGAYSIVRFDLQPKGSGSHLSLDHIGFPEGLHDHLAEGWESNYWSLLKKYFR